MPSPPPPPPRPATKPAAAAISQPKVYATGSPRAVKRLSSSSSLFPKRSCFRLPSLFNSIRAGVFVAVLLWTVVCLAIAVHFQTLLVASDLTHFIPFAIFVSAATILIIITLLLSTVFRRKIPVQTRIELGLLGLLGLLWLALSVFLAISDSGEADVECFAADSNESDPTTFPGFSTETYHAQYRVLEAFSIFNAILVWGFLLFLLFLAFRHHRAGHTEVWTMPVPEYPWFGKGKEMREEGLPAPVTAMSRRRRKRSTHRPATTTTTAAMVRGLPLPAGRVTAPVATRDRSTTQQAGAAKPEKRQSAFWVWVEKPRLRPRGTTTTRTMTGVRAPPATYAGAGGVGGSRDRRRENQAATTGNATVTTPRRSQSTRTHPPVMTQVKK